MRDCALIEVKVSKLVLHPCKSSQRFGVAEHELIDGVQICLFHCDIGDHIALRL